MFAGIVRHSKAILGAIFTVAGIWPGLKWLLDWGGRIDVFRTWGNFVVELSPTIPPWLSLVFVIVGMIFIWRDLKGTSASPASIPERLPPPPSDRIGITANATVLSPAKYSKAQINKIVEAIDIFYPSMVEIERALIFGHGIAGSLEAIIRNNGAEEFLSRMDSFRLQYLPPSDELDKAIETYGLYKEVCQVVNEKTAHHDALFSSYNDLAGLLRVIPDKLSVPALSAFVEAKKATFTARVSDYLVWVKQKKLALADYREWYLRRPTTD